jgi:hypothetical protein
MKERFEQQKEQPKQVKARGGEDIERYAKRVVEIAQNSDVEINFNRIKFVVPKGEKDSEKISKEWRTLNEQEEKDPNSPQKKAAAEILAIEKNFPSYFVEEDDDEQLKYIMNRLGKTVSSKYNDFEMKRFFDRAMLFGIKNDGHKVLLKIPTNADQYIEESEEIFDKIDFIEELGCLIAEIGGWSFILDRETGSRVSEKYHSINFNSDSKLLTGKMGAVIVLLDNKSFIPISKEYHEIYITEDGKIEGKLGALKETIIPSDQPGQHNLLITNNKMNTHDKIESGYNKDVEKKMFVFNVAKNHVGETTQVISDDDYNNIESEDFPSNTNWEKVAFLSVDDKNKWVILDRELYLKRNNHPQDDGERERNEIRIEEIEAEMDKLEVK